MQCFLSSCAQIKGGIILNEETCLPAAYAGVCVLALLRHAEGKKHVENLIVGTTAANNTFNMTTQSDAFGRMNYNGLTQGNYVYRDANGDLQPYFFTSYEISEDGKVLDFTWHKGAIWHDGQPVTDEDIIFTFEFQRDVKKVGGLSNLVSVEITGENAARLTFSQPDVYYYLNTSCMNTACIYAKHIWEGIEDYSHYTGEDACHWLRPVQAGGLRCGFPDLLL